jgi:hypothetical protein
MRLPPEGGISVSEQLKKVPLAVRPIVRAARRMVKAIAPKAKEIAYRSQPPRSSRSMWKSLTKEAGCSKAGEAPVHPVALASGPRATPREAHRAEGVQAQGETLVGSLRSQATK